LGSLRYFAPKVKQFFSPEEQGQGRKNLLFFTYGLNRLKVRPRVLKRLTEIVPVVDYKRNGKLFKNI
jgi:hypothetical protein